MTANVPAVVENRLDAISCTEDDKIVLASSNLTGRYWNGSLWYFDTVDNAPNVEKCLSGIDASAGISDLAYIDQSKVALGLDSGGLEVYKIETEPVNFILTYSVCEHDDYITSLSANSDKSSLVTVGADKCVKVWDLGTWSTNSTFRPAHGGIIWQVACSSDDPNIFVTCGQDGKILLFDLRLPKPASIIDTSSLKGEPTSVSWKSGSSSTFAVGDESGIVALKDIRQTGSLSSWEPHRRRIHRMAFSLSQPWLATCADDTDVCVTNLKEETPVVLYKDDRHGDYVRGLTWTSQNELVSCGWDKKVLKHFCKTDS